MTPSFFPMNSKRRNVNSVILTLTSIYHHRKVNIVQQPAFRISSPFTNSHKIMAHPGGTVKVKEQEYVERRLQQKERRLGLHEALHDDKLGKNHSWFNSLLEGSSHNCSDNVTIVITCVSTVRRISIRKKQGHPDQ